MLGNFVVRIVVGVITVTFFTGLRMYFVYHMMSQAHYHANGPNQVRYRPAAIVERAPPLPPDHSGWIVFNSDDPSTGTMTRHAKLFAAAADTPEEHAEPRRFLELTAGKGSGHHALFTLPRLACASLTTLDAAFDNRAPRPLKVKSAAGPDCVAEVEDYDGFLQSVRDADTMEIRGEHIAPTTFAVGGLSWD